MHLVREHLRTHKLVSIMGIRSIVMVLIKSEAILLDVVLLWRNIENYQKNNNTLFLYITETSPYKNYSRFAPNIIIVKTGEIWG